MKSPKFLRWAVVPTALVAVTIGAVALRLSAGVVPPGPLPFGAYDPDGDFSDEAGLTIEHVFMPWEDVSLASLAEADTYAAARNRALLVTLEPWTWSRDERNSAETLRNGIANGTFDANMKAVCDVLGGLKSAVTLRWGHEMETVDGQFIWAGWAPDDYIGAFRRMVDVCRASAPSVNFMWSPLGEAGMEAYYPGDAYVDLVGLSVFGLQAWDRAKFKHDRSFTEILAPRYTRAIAFGKPVVVAELGYSGSAAYVAAWENEVRQIGGAFPKLVGVVYFDYPEVYNWPDGFGLPDWRISERVINVSG